MRSGLIAKKIGMTRLFSKDGTDTPVTVLKLDNVQVTDLMNKDKNGYFGIQVGAGSIKSKNVTKPLRGHFTKAKVEPKRVLKEFRVSQEMSLKIGDTFSANHFMVGQKVDVTGTSIGKGFSGAMKRHNFSGLRASHGVSISHRSHGSTGNSQDPGKVWKGKKMAGQYGNVQKTIQGLTVVEIDESEGLIFIKGSIPGSKNSYVAVKDSVKHHIPDGINLPAGLMRSGEGETDSKNNELLNRNDVKKESQKNLEDEIENIDAKTVKEENPTEKTTELNADKTNDNDVKKD